MNLQKAKSLSVLYLVFDVNILFYLGMLEQ